jgi:integrase
MNELAFNWKKIRKGLPVARQAANDRAPTVEEIQKLTEYPDIRIKPIVYTMISSGIRLGAWDYLKWKHVIPTTDNSGQVMAAKLIVYAGEPEEYYAFITPTAYHLLKEWMEFRHSYGEAISKESWLMRDIWQTTNVNYKSKFGLATCPKKLKSSGIKRLIERGLWEQGLRQPLENGSRRHEWKAAHGFRKFYKSRAEQYRPLEKDVLQDYLKAVDELTIDGDTKLLQKQVAELEEKRRDSDYIIQAKLREKEGEIEELKSQMSDVLTTLKMAKTKDGMIAKNRTILDSKRRVTFGYIGDDNELVNVKIPIDSVEIQ